MEIVVAISRLLSCVCQPAACQAICQQLNYIRKVKENEQSLREELDYLTSRGIDISAKLNKGKVQQGKSPKEEVTNWLENLKEIKNDVNSLGSSDAHHMCFKGFCPNYYSRLKRSKKTEKILLRVKALREKGDSFATGENIFVDSLPETSFSLPATTLQGSSAMRKRDEILQCIMDPEVSKVGVFGMGGVGKTTIMRQIYNQLKGMRDFDIVMWVTVSSSFNLETLQDKIAELLGCQLSSSAEETSRAMVLHEAFIRRRKFVLILDDIWDIVSLQNVGIPEPDTSNGSKIVWTTHSIRVCNSMESQREIKVEGLTSEEAWSLFKDKVGGEAVIMSPTIEEIARQVADECAGLPLALMGCHTLKCLPSLANLQKLRQLKLAGLSWLTELPHGFENLVKLRHLDISGGGWASFPSGALSKMTCLEVLFMQSSGWTLPCGNDRYEKDNSTFGEIISLKKLTKFAVDFGDVGTFNCFINKSVKSGLLKHVDIFRLGVRYKCDGLGVENESMRKVILPDTANYLGINRDNFIQLSDIFGSADLRQFIDSEIYYCNEMEWIQKDGEIVLPNLRKLTLAGLHSFKGLCKEKAHEETLKNLTHIYIYGCPKLKYFTPIDLLVTNLQNLKEISIGRCCDMEEIISGNASAATTILLPKLKKMVLRNLPVLTSICQEKLVCDSLCEIQVAHCPNMKKLPFLINNVPPDFKRIAGAKKWWETLKWDDPQMEQLLHPFFEDNVMYADRYRLESLLKRARLNDEMIKIERCNMQEYFQD